MCWTDCQDANEGTEIVHRTLALPRPPSAGPAIRQLLLQDERQGASSRSLPNYSHGVCRSPRLPWARRFSHTVSSELDNEVMRVVVIAPFSSTRQHGLWPFLCPCRAVPATWQIFSRSLLYPCSDYPLIIIKIYTGSPKPTAHI